MKDENLEHLLETLIKMQGRLHAMIDDVTSRVNQLEDALKTDLPLIRSANL